MIQAVVKIWPLPDLSQSQLKELLDLVLKAAQTAKLPVDSLEDLFCQLPHDMCAVGKGEELLVEVTVAVQVGEKADPVNGPSELVFRQTLGQMIHKFMRATEQNFPKMKVRVMREGDLTTLQTFY